MSTTGDIELVTSEEDRLLEPVQEATTVDIAPVPSEKDRLLEAVRELPLQSRHSIFLSHSGAQKNFVEQLCLDMEQQLNHTPFFDKRPDSLPKGEVFAQYIFQAAQQCEVAVVVVSEEYFSRSKWPMLELSTLVHSSRCKILPLFFGLSCKEFGDAERRQRWFQTWDAWAQIDPRVSVTDWKLALREVDRRNGLEFVAAVGEVAFRKEVLATVSAIVPSDWVEVEKGKVPLHVPKFDQTRVLSRLFLFFLLKFFGFIVFFILFALLFFKVIVPIIFYFVLPKDFSKGF